MKHFITAVFALVGMFCSLTVMAEGKSVEVVSLKLKANSYKPNSRGSAIVQFRNTGAACNKVTIYVECEGKISQFTYSYIASGDTKQMSTGFSTPDHNMPAAVVKAYVVSIDDEPYNDPKPATATFEVKALYPRTVVIEEGTGTWCGYCPRGFVAMEKMKQKYPDGFIGISVHINDPMQVEEYVNHIGFTFAPGCNVDRLPSMSALKNVDTNYFNTYYTSESTRGAEADFTFDAQIVGSKIVGQSKAKFDFNRPNADIRMVYAIIEDGVTGYKQRNYFSGGSHGEMDGYENKPDPLTDHVFNEVARAIYPSYAGESGSLAADVVYGQEYVHSFEYDVPDNVVNAENLSIVAMMLDGTTGEIINAHQMKLAVADVIEGVAESAKTDDTRWYNIDGTMLHDIPSKGGVYIRNGRKIIAK